LHFKFKDFLIKMILPIVAYGSNILRQVCVPIDEQNNDLPELLANMWQTMYNSNGVGLAAPQINRNLRLFLVDTIQIVEGAETDEEREDFKDEVPIKQVFINAEILEEDGDEWIYNEGCLSIPKVRADVPRLFGVTLKYMDENFVEYTQRFEGVTARVILHEFDHIEGKLFIDRLKPLKRKMLGGKLDAITKGKVSVSYKMVHLK
jgi:peptide deformylase